METELLTPDELATLKSYLDATDDSKFSATEVKFLAGLVTRTANKAKLTNDQLMRSVKLLRLVLKEVL